MPQPARVLGVADARRLLKHVRTHRHPHRDTVTILLSFKAGLRACEIAGLDWSMVLRPDATLSQQIAVANRIAKNGSGRIIPLHRDLRGALAKLHMDQGWPRAGPIIRSERGGHMTARSIVNWFASLYSALQLDGCSSHSGRRTFITRSARLLSKTGGSLRDVQELAGHRSLTTTERYIAGDRDAQRKVTRSIHEGARDLARDIANTGAYVTSRRQRKKVEMLFAHLKRILKLDRLRLRGPNGARDEFHMAATAQNLRKMAKLIPMPTQPLPA